MTQRATPSTRTHSTPCANSRPRSCASSSIGCRESTASLYGLFLSSALAGSYLACAFFKTSKSIREFKQAFLRRYNFGSKAFSCAHGTPATKADIENLGLEFECAICQEKEIIAPLKLECNHVFCEECVEPWFEKDNTTCPLCRAVVVEKRKDELKSLSSGETHFLPVIF